MCRSTNGSIHRLYKGLGALAIVAAVAMGGARLSMAEPDANTCNGSSELNYPTAPNFSSVGDTVHVVLTLGAGGIQGGTSLSISRVRFNLDCDSSNLGINCPDDGGVVSYQGNLSTTCASNFTSSHSVNDVLPNQVVFTPTAAIVVPANTPAFCTLEFDVKIETTSNDATPNVVEQVSGFDANVGDGVCNTVPPLAAGNTNSGSLTLCPVCDDGNQCNGVETCDPQLGCQPGTPITCNDNNVCTSDSCDATIPAPADPCVYTPGAQGSCDDNNVCTTDACDPIAGCTHTPGAQGSCDDNNVCTTDTCDPINGCTHTPGAQGSCDDNNVCTTDACDPIAGCTHTPGAQGSCDDNNTCTTDACDPTNGCTHTPGAQGDCNDNDKCTTDSCDPVTGCTHTPGALNCDDNNVCTTDSCDPVDGCVNTPGALNCDDKNVCTDDSCDPVDGCVYKDHSNKCDDGNSCTDDSCDPVDGCQHTDNGSCNLVCRTPGFWGTHADADPGKACSQDITGAVIELAGGSLSVCGECISNNNLGETLAPGDAAGALEALCVKVQGQQTRQLARQLLSAALNCVMSNVGNTCAGTDAIDWATCNAVCQGTSSALTVGQCIGSLDAFNNGIGTGCHDRELPFDTIFPNGTRCTTSGGGPKQGPAGSADECQTARGNTCTTIQPNENNCATDSCP